MQTKFHAIVRLAERIGVSPVSHRYEGGLFLRTDPGVYYDLILILAALLDRFDASEKKSRGSSDAL